MKFLQWKALVKDLVTHLPAGASYKQFVHYGQIISASMLGCYGFDNEIVVFIINNHNNSLEGKFLRFDHGAESNFIIYGQRYPPEYNLSHIVTKVHILYGSNDWIIPKAVSCGHCDQSRLLQMKIFLFRIFRFWQANFQM